MSMDIFRWLDDISAQLGDGEPHPFDVFGRLRTASTSLDDDGVRSARIEYERLATTYDLPWLGVFGRHWELQYRLMTRREGATAIADAVRAFEMSHRDETIECPQSMCTVQDLCIAYSNVDGPGYSEQTVQAAKDGLARIDPTWPCWDCLSSELVDGLAYSRNHAAAVEKCAEIEVQIRSTGENPSVNNATTRLRQLVLDGNIDAATAFDTELVRQRYNAHTEDAWPLYQLTRGMLLVRRGDIAEAVATFRDSQDPLEKQRFGDDWRALAMELLRAGHIDNDDEVAATFVQLGHHYRSVGAWRRAFDTFADAAIVAAMRGAMSSARRAQQACAEIVGDLVQPLDAPERLADIETAIAAAPSHVVDSAPLDVEIERLEGELEHEFTIERFSRLAQLLQEQGWGGLARARLWEHVQSQPDDERASLTLMSMLLSAKGPTLVDELTDLASLLEPVDEGLADWVRANTHAGMEEWSKCADRCEAVARRNPDAKNTRRLWAKALREQALYEDAAKLWHEILDLAEPDRVTPEEAEHRLYNDSWSAIISASLAGDWPLVRRSGATLNMSFSTESGPVEERWETIVIKYPAEGGRARTSLVAQRTGPVTATIFQPTTRGKQCFQDRVVFDPTRLNQLPPDATDEQKAEFLFEYEIIDTVGEAGFTGYMVEGAIPGDDGSWWADARDALRSAGFGAWLYNVGKDQLRATGTDEAVLLFNAVVPPTTAPGVLIELLTSLAEPLEHPLAWPELAKAANIDADLHRDRLDTMWGEEPADV